MAALLPPHSSYTTSGDFTGAPRVALSPTEYGILAELAAHAGRVVTHQELLERVWGARGEGNLRALHTIVSKLRRKLGDDPANPAYIFAEPRVGFRMPGGNVENVRTGLPPAWFCKRDVDGMNTAFPATTKVVGSGMASPSTGRRRKRVRKRGLHTEFDVRYHE